jgi:hypothetical protein
MLFAEAAIGCVGTWLALFARMRQHKEVMVKEFFASKFGRTVVALAAGALAPAMPALVMGDTHTARIACGSALGAVVAAVALHFKSEGAS